MGMLSRVVKKTVEEEIPVCECDACGMIQDLAPTEQDFAKPTPPPEWYRFGRPFAVALVFCPQCSVEIDELITSLRKMKRERAA